MKYRKKPVVIEAMQWNGENWKEIRDWNTPDGREATIGENGPTLTIWTLEGVMTANIGDWIIKGVKGEFYPCKPDIFEATYEPAE